MPLKIKDTTRKREWCNHTLGETLGTQETKNDG